MTDLRQRSGSARPLIAVTGRRFMANSFNTPEMDWALAGVQIDGFYTPYALRLAAAGAMPIFVTRECDVEELVGLADGVLIAGGVDLDPRTYGGDLTPHSTLLDPEHDEFEITLARTAVKQRVPILGTCRGHEVLNVALGGTLHGHLTGPSGPRHRREMYPLSARGHLIRCSEGSTIRRLYGERAEVNSFHHQAIDRLGDGVRVSALAEDEIIEAIEVEGADAIGVQWHPEFAAEVEPVVRWLVERAAVRAEGRPS